MNRHAVTWAAFVVLMVLAWAPLVCARTPIDPSNRIYELRADPSDHAGHVILTFTHYDNDEKGVRPAPIFDVRISTQHFDMDPRSERHPSRASKIESTSRAIENGNAALEVGPLEAGRTFQFMVRATGAGKHGPWSDPASSRVPGALVYTARKHTIELSGPTTLKQSDTRYVLTNGVECDGTAFTIAAVNVTLDLNGHTVKYGRGSTKKCFGVASEYLYDPGTSIVCNGTLIQAGKGAMNHGIQFRGGHHLRFSNVRIEVKGPDSSGIVVFEQPAGTLRVDHCTVACRTKVVTNRSYPGVAAVWMEGIVGPCEIDQNLVVASPQWGIKIQGKETKGSFLIHHNRVMHTVSRVANSYMVGVHKPFADVFENQLHGESRGIHIDGEDNFGHDAHIHHNRVHSSDRPNPEYPDLHWTHGIKMERGARAYIHHNTVDAFGDKEHGGAYALDVALGPARGSRVVHNVFRARSTHEPYPARALSWTEGPEKASTRADPAISLFENVFEATDELIQRAWGAGNGALIHNNVWLPDDGKGAKHQIEFERWDVADTLPSVDHVIRDAISPLSTTSGTQWANPAPFHSAREATLRVLVQGGDGKAIEGAKLRVVSHDGKQTMKASTNDHGEAHVTLKFADITKGPKVVMQPPFRVSVTHGSMAYSGSHSVSGPTAIHVVLESSNKSRAQTDTVAPKPPTKLMPHPISASRALIRMKGATDDLSVVAYIVMLDGRTMATSTSAVVELGGLESGRTYDVQVIAVDGSNLQSKPSTSVRLTMPKEDRGP